tara:strand:+ start:194 stop:370 length:177 start_codon:yes stop_codon:yes gene_type:complete
MQRLEEKLQIISKIVGQIERAKIQLLDFQALLFKYCLRSKLKFAFHPYLIELFFMMPD